MAAPIWATKHYVCATKYQFLGAQVATKALKSVCSTEHTILKFASALWLWETYAPLEKVQCQIVRYVLNYSHN